MIFARRALLFAGVHKVSATVWTMRRMSTGARSSELIGDIAACGVVFHG
jgi:hypothetical protein